MRLAGLMLTMGLAASGTAAAAGPSFDTWGTGEAALAYHRVSGDCEAVSDRFGRNAAWGYWRMPLSAVTVTLAPASEGEGTRLRFVCRDGSACIAAGKLDSLEEAQVAHDLAFDTVERAEEVLGMIKTLRAACGGA
ncbi:MAG: hypothetical protein GC145_00320 [Caulobacter sp.]|nr:hypothetical protein [Caulobacter sp.]